MPNYDLSEELLNWAKEHGKERTALSGAMYYGFDYRARRREHCLVILVQKLKDLGAEKGTFKGRPTREAIVEMCLPPKQAFPTPKKYLSACVCVEKELDRAVLEVYGSESDYYKQHGTTRIDIQTQSVTKHEAQRQFDILYDIGYQAYEAQLKAREANPVLASTSPPPQPPKKWEDVKKELIASGKLVEEEYEFTAEADVFASLGIKP